MWQLAHTLETSVAPDVIWRRLMDVERWPEWDESITSARVKGKFRKLAIGSRAVLDFAMGQRLNFRVVEQIQGRILICSGRRFGFSYSLEHHLQPTHLGARVTRCFTAKGIFAWVLRLTLGRHLQESLPKAARKLAQAA